MSFVWITLIGASLTLGTLWMVWPRLMVETGTVQTDQHDRERERALARLVQLERDYQIGLIEPARYEHQRQLLKQKIQRFPAAKPTLIDPLAEIRQRIAAEIEIEAAVARLSRPIDN